MGINEVQDVLAIHTEHAASTCAIAVDSKGSYAADNQAVTNEIGAA
jgi:hypothetical protein